MHAIMGATGSLNLQATLAAASSGSDQPLVIPHHPITCSTSLTYDDGKLGCDHAEAPSEDRRTQHALVHSIAILLIECAVDYFGSDYFGPRG